MKPINIYGGSDFHLEFEYCKKGFNPANVLPALEDYDPEAVNICLLAGDITNSKKVHSSLRWFEKFCELFDFVYYVEGNHEQWRGSWGQNFDRLRRHSSHIENLIFLSRDHVRIDLFGKRIDVVGATLWSDLRQIDDLSLYELTTTQGYLAKPIVKDFWFIRNVDRRRITSGDYNIRHSLDRKFIEQQVEFLEDVESFKILLTHHSPSLASLYKYDGWRKEYDAFDATDLSDSIPNGFFDLVVHGHIHRQAPFETVWHGMKLISNPAGYEELSNPKSTYKLLKLASI